MICQIGDFHGQLPQAVMGSHLADGLLQPAQGGAYLPGDIEMTVFLGELVDRLGWMVEIGGQMDLAGVLHTGRARADVVQKHIQRPAGPQMVPVEHQDDLIQGSQEIFRRTAVCLAVKIIPPVSGKR